MGQKKLVNTTDADVYVSFMVRLGDDVSQTDTSGNWNWTVPGSGGVVWANYDPETYLNGVQAQYYNSADGNMSSAGISVLVKSNTDDDDLNTFDTITLSMLGGSNLVLAYSNTWTV